MPATTRTHVREETFADPEYTIVAAIRKPRPAGRARVRAGDPVLDALPL